MKLAILSDLHLHPFPQFSKAGPEGISSRLDEIYRTASVAFQGAAYQSCKAVIFAGDWFHTKTISAEVLDLTGRLMSLASKLGLDVSMVPGNHDMTAQGVHALRALAPHVRFLDEGPVEFGNKKFRIAGLAYSPKRDELLARAKLLKGQDVLVLHAPCVGAEMASDIVAIDEEDTIRTDQILQTSRSKMIVCGHYHKPQIYRGEWTSDLFGSTMSGKWLTSVQALVPGAPCQHCFGDARQKRGYWVLDAERMAVQFNPIDLAHEFLPLTYEAFLKDPSVVLDRYVRLELPEDLPASTREDIIQTVREAAAGLQVLTKHSAQRKEEAPRSTMKPGMTPVQLVEIYAQKDPPPHKERTLELAKEIVKKAE